MSYPETFKEGFIKQIEKELNKCEIIYNPNTKGIWFINREEKYWYLEYKIETNYLWWRYEFFNMLKTLFSMPDEVFNDVISEWVEDTLNCKVLSTKYLSLDKTHSVEDTLNCKVLTTNETFQARPNWVEDTLNIKVLKTNGELYNYIEMVEDTLNCKVLSTEALISFSDSMVEETLNLK